MAKQFVKGNKYVFVAKKCKKGIRKHSYSWSESKNWVNSINGGEVEFDNNFIGYIGIYRIVPQWCKCIGVDVNE